MRTSRAITAQPTKNWVKEGEKTESFSRVSIHAVSVCDTHTESVIGHGRTALALSPYMEAIFSKNKQFCRLLHENFLLPTHKFWQRGGEEPRMKHQPCGTAGCREIQQPGFSRSRKWARKGGREEFAGNVKLN